jgi:hypothetical protein
MAALVGHDAAELEAALAWTPLLGINSRTCAVRDAARNHLELCRAYRRDASWSPSGIAEGEIALLRGHGVHAFSSAGAMRTDRRHQEY